MGLIMGCFYSSIRLYSALLTIEAAESEKQMLLAAKTVRLFISDSPHKKSFEPLIVGDKFICQEYSSHYFVAKIENHRQPSYRQSTQNADAPETLKTVKIFFSKSNLEEIFIARVTHPDALCINMCLLGYQLELVGDSMEILAGKQRGMRIEKYPAPKPLFRVLKWWQNKRASAKQ